MCCHNFFLGKVQEHFLHYYSTRYYDITRYDPLGIMMLVEPHDRKAYMCDLSSLLQPLAVQITKGSEYSQRL